MSSSGSVTLLYLVKQVELAVRAQLEKAVGPAGLTSLQYTALTVLERHGGTTSAQLARNSFVRAQTMAQMTSSLEAAGLIRRKLDPGNRRQHLLHLTDAGRAVLAELRVPVMEVERRALSGLTEAEAQQLRVALRSCRHALGGEQQL